MHIGRQLSRVLASLAACLLVIGGVAVAASPAMADRPYEVSAEELEAICAAFHGDFAVDRVKYACVLASAEILCEAVTQSCDYLTEAEMPRSFESDCVKDVNGKFTATGPNSFACQFGWGTIMVDCPEPSDIPEPEPCSVGAIRSEVPVR